MSIQLLGDPSQKKKIKNKTIKWGGEGTEKRISPRNKRETTKNRRGIDIFRREKNPLSSQPRGITLVLWRGSLKVGRSEKGRMRDLLETRIRMW